MKLSLSDFAAKLRTAAATENAQFCIVYHINPDGDCIGSAYALMLILRTLGAKCAVCGRDPVPANFRNMTDAVSSDRLDGNVQYIGVDCKDRSRTGSALQDKPYTFWIDHHGSPEEEAAYEYTVPAYSACAELVLALAAEMAVPLTKQTANLLYTALLTDTLCFRTVSTNAATFEAAAQLARAGADIYRIGRKYAMIKSQSRLRLEQIIYADMHLLCDGQLVSGLITQQDMQDAGIAESNGPDMQNINSLLEAVASAKITLMIREYPPDNPEGHTRFMLKTLVPEISAREIAVRFGGGGHVQAAGGFMNESPQRTREILEEVCTQYLQK